MPARISADATRISEVAERQLAALVDVSSPSGDKAGAEAALAVVAALLPAAATVERVPCSSPGHADDLVARLTGTGRPRLLLVGHVDTVVAHEAHEPLVADGENL